MHERVLAVQQVSLEHLYSPDVLARIQNSALKADKDERPLSIAEVFRAITDAVWSDLKDDRDHKLTSSAVRRNLQREQLKYLFGLVLGESATKSFGPFVIVVGRGSPPPDARSLARLHLREICRRIGSVTADGKAQLDETTRAHLEECQERISRVLSASMQVREP